MTTASTSSWMPQVGQCKVKAGSSIRRALNQRSGKATAPSKFDRDYFAFRYNNKPPSIDSSKAGTLAVRKGQDVTNVQVEFPSQTNGTGDAQLHQFVGQETVAKEWECILIWDDITGELSIEKLDSTVLLKANGKVSAPTPSTSTPLSASSTSSLPNTKREKLPIMHRDALDKDILATLNEDDDDDKPPSRYNKGEDEEEGEEREYQPMRSVVPPARPPSVHQRDQPSSLASKPLPPKPRSPSRQAKPPVASSPLRREKVTPAKLTTQLSAPTVTSTSSIPSSKPKAIPPAPPARTKRELDAPPETDVEHFDTGKPSKKVKRERDPSAVPRPTTNPTKSTAAVHLAHNTNTNGLPRPGALANGNRNHTSLSKSALKEKSEERGKDKEKRFGELALPGASSGFALPSIPTLPHLRNSSTTTLSHSLHSKAESDGDSEEEDWEEATPIPGIATAGSLAGGSDKAVNGFFSEGLVEVDPSAEIDQEIDEDLFAQELGEEMEVDVEGEVDVDVDIDGFEDVEAEAEGEDDWQEDDDGDFLADAIEDSNQAPLPLSQWVDGGGGGEDSEDDYSSSDDSDDDD